MNRRRFLSGSAALAACVSSAFPACADAAMRGAEIASANGRDLLRHRFGVNYTPSRNWWFCWNDWDPGSIQRDLDAIAGLGADHLRILLIWPYFQPNLTWISPVHLERLEQLLTFMAERKLDALPTIFTGQLSGWLFLPPFNRPDPAFFTDQTIYEAQSLFLRTLAALANRHANVIGFDLGNEINTCWTAPTQDGDAWMRRVFSLLDSAMPGSLNVNGVDHKPWFEDTTFSAHALAAQRFPVMHCYPWWTGALKYGGPMDPPSTHLLAGMAALIRSYAGTQQKPVWAGEFNTCIAALSEQQQAEWLDRAVHAALEQGVSWFTYWDSHDVDRRFTFNSVEYTLGLLTNDGRVKDQGRKFRELADSYRGKPVVFPTAELPAPPSPHTQQETWQWLLRWMHWTPRNT